MIRILIADNQMLTRQGVMSALADHQEIVICGHAGSPEELKLMLWAFKPDVIIMDPNYGRDYSANDIQNIYAIFDFVRILILANRQHKNDILEIINHGIKNYVCKESTVEELLEAIHATVKREQYYCKKTQETLFGNVLPPKKAGSTPLLSYRETEIIQLIAEGKANKEIAEKLFLSVHTIKTHRKNIIKKLGFTFKHASELIFLLSYLNDIFI